MDRWYPPTRLEQLEEQIPDGGCLLVFAQTQKQILNWRSSVGKVFHVMTCNPQRAGAQKRGFDPQSLRDIYITRKT
jgi:hypothetical protein